MDASELAGLLELAGYGEELSGYDLAGIELAGLDDLAGLDELSGEDEVSGLVELAGRLKRAKAARSGVRGGAGNIAAMLQSKMGRQKLLISPIPATTIAAGASANVTWRPQFNIRMERLVLVSSVSPTVCNVSDFVVGQRTQFANAGNVPLSVFDPTSVGIKFRGDTANLGQDVVLTINNAGIAAETITGCVFGVAVDPAGG